MTIDTSREELRQTIIEILHNPLARQDVINTLDNTRSPAVVEALLNLFESQLSHLITQIKDTLPKKLDMLDCGELGGADGRSGYSAVAVSHRNGYNACLKEVTALLDKWEKQ